MSTDAYFYYQSIFADALGIIGFAIAVITLFVANSARKAAQLARKSVSFMNMLDELKVCQQKITIMQTFIDKADWQTAHYFANEITQSINHLVAKWVDHHKQIKSLLTDIDSIGEIIASAIQGKIDDQGIVQVRILLKKMLRTMAFVAVKGEGKIEPHLNKEIA